MDRLPEPELMDAPDQVAAYAAADFEAPDTRFVEAFVRLYGADFQGKIADLGCGPGNIALRLAAALPAVWVLGVDGAGRMLDEARRRSQGSRVEARVVWQQAFLPTEALPGHPFEAVVSNSLLHHLHDPAGLWRTIRQVAAPGAAILVGDLRRPPSVEAARALVATYVANEPPVLQADFFASLCAAFEVDEVRAQLDAAGLGALTVEALGDRHLVVSGRLDNAPSD